MIERPHRQVTRRVGRRCAAEPVEQGWHDEGDGEGPPRSARRQQHWRPRSGRGRYEPMQRVPVHERGQPSRFGPRPVDSALELSGQGPHGQRCARQRERPNQAPSKQQAKCGRNDGRRQLQGRNLGPMLGSKIGRRRAIGKPLPGDCGKRAAIAMLDHSTRLVPHDVSGVDQPPNEVDILAEPHRLVEPSGIVDHRCADGEHRRRHIGQPSARKDECCGRAHIEWRVVRLVGGDGRGARCSSNPRSDRRDVVVLEVREHEFQRLRSRRDIGIDEDHDVQVWIDADAVTPTRVASCAGPAVAVVPDQLSPMSLCDLGDRGLVRRSVVDNYHRCTWLAPFDCGQQSFET